MKEIIEFLDQLRHNNNREWFEANKSRYKEDKARFEDFTLRLIDAIGAFDSTVRGLTVRDCTYRIYRDVRFSPDKRPYKNHIGAYICRGGKNSGYAGYYFHLESGGDSFLGGSLITSGIYMPQGNVLRSLRDEIYDNGESLTKAMKKAVGFSLDTTQKLKRLPVGYEPGPYDELLRQKDLYLVQQMKSQWLESEDPAAVVAAEYAKTKDFIDQINRAVEFAYEEM